MTNDAITAGMPTVKKNGMIGMKPPMAVETLAESVERQRVGKGLLGEAELLVDQRAQELLRLLLQPLGHRPRFFGGESLELVEQLELEHLLVRVLLDLRRSRATSDS